VKAKYGKTYSDFPLHISPIQVSEHTLGGKINFQSHRFYFYLFIWV